MINLFKNLKWFESKKEKDKPEDNIIDIVPISIITNPKPKLKIEHLGETDLYINLPTQDVPLEETGNVYRKYDPETNETLEIYCLFYPYRINYDIDIYENCKKLEMISTIKGEKVTIKEEKCS
jgi:hypothetical protein